MNDKTKLEIKDTLYFKSGELECEVKKLNLNKTTEKQLINIINRVML